MKRPMPPLEWDAHTVQLHGFARGVHQIQWLLVTLVLLYLILAGDPLGGDQVAALGTLIYFGVSMAVHALTKLGLNRRWMLALHTWVMIGFITWLLLEMRGIEGPLVGLYILAVITSALALGKLATLLEVAVIASCYLLSLYQGRGLEAFAGADLAVAGAHVVMFLLVGYLTTMMADAIHLANERMLLMAHTDQLTGLANRAAFATRTENLDDDAVRVARRYAVVMADMDNLKKINDEHGHAAGDEALAAVARHLESATRKQDITARLGGDEFVAVLPDASIEDGRKVAERLLRAIGALPASPVPPRVSIGVAACPQHGRAVQAVLRHADDAMYRAKRAGGHAVCVSGVEAQPANAAATA